MDCERCGQRPASVRYRDPGDVLGEPLWLCHVCAGEVAGHRPEPLDAFVTPDLEAPGEETCPGCGWTAAQFRRTNRLGCPACYGSFRSMLLPVLGRFHRHVSHLGRRPRRSSEQPGRLNEITRTRVALEKAIAREDFEAAAALRDRIRDLENRGPEQS
jgi:protein arginine kinase activator